MSRKMIITEEVLIELSDDDTIPAQAYTRWWWPDTTRGENLRLTKLGFETLNQAFTSYKFSTGLPNTAKSLIALQKLNTPFYVTRDISTIHVFSDQLAVMLKLYPDVKSYLDLVD